MSNYSDFIKDFPNRCNELLKCFEKLSPIPNREVTLMLCMATAGFGIPFERIRPNKPRNEHPTRDRKRHEDFCKMTDSLFKKPFKETELWDSSFDEKWFFSGSSRNFVGGSGWDGSRFGVEWRCCVA
jgi:hypothetical protein